VHDIFIQDLGFVENYNYLGLQQLLGVSDKKAREAVEKKVLSKVEKICTSKLSARNMTNAINMWTIPVAGYILGVC
jgi:hypothetical protein